MEAYTTVLQSGKFEYEDKKSVFYGEAMPVSNENEALQFLTSVKKKYPDATHHVYAYVLRENSIMRFSDDREPQGTAGLPILDTIRKNDCTDVIIVVTRYFGGTLLGTGGLVRAYTAAAVGALRDAQIIRYDIYTSFEIELSYSDHAKIVSLLEESGFRTKNTDYSDSVKISGSIKKDAAQSLVDSITDALSGRAEFKNFSDNFEF